MKIAVVNFRTGTIYGPGKEHRNDIPENKGDFFARVARREGLEPVNWLGVVKGPKAVSNARTKATGSVFADPVGAREGDDLLAG